MKMQFTNEEKKSMVITAAVSGILLIILLLIRFVETIDASQLAGGGGGGVEINFGDSDLGMGPDFTSEVLNVSDANKAAAARREIISEEDIIFNYHLQRVLKWLKKQLPQKNVPKQ